MLQIAVWGLAGMLVVLSTVPLFVVRAGTDPTAGRGWARAVALCGIGFAAFLLYAAAKQAGDFDLKAPAEAPPPGNPFLNP